LLALNNWPPGIVSLHFGSTLYINASMNCLYNSTFELNKQLNQYHLHPNHPMHSHNRLVLNNQRMRSKSLDNPTKLQSNNFHNIIERYLFLQKKILSGRRNLPTRSLNSRPRNILGKSKWKSTGQLPFINI